MKMISKSLVCFIAYLTGVREDILNNHYGKTDSSLLSQLQQDIVATKVRHLCQLRTNIIANCDRVISSYLGLNSETQFAEDFKKKLEQIVVSSEYVHDNAEDVAKTLNEINKEIKMLLPSLTGYIPDWVDKKVIYSLFLFNNFTEVCDVRTANRNYHRNINKYPYQVYINLDVGKICGNLFVNDKHFLTTVYEICGCKVPEEVSQKPDNVAQNNTNIHEFLKSSTRGTTIIVDCENADVYKLYAFLQSLSADELKLIQRILLFDDEHTTDTWKLLQEFSVIDVRYTNVERVIESKSVVDLRVCSETCREYYAYGIDRFLIVASDSDYCTLFKALPGATFFVLYEEHKMSAKILDSMTALGVKYASIDSYSEIDIKDLKDNALKAELSKYLNTLLSVSLEHLTYEIYKNCRIRESEEAEFEYIKKLINSAQIKIDDAGTLRVVVPDE